MGCGELGRGWRTAVRGVGGSGEGETDDGADRECCGGEGGGPQVCHVGMVRPVRGWRIGANLGRRRAGSGLSRIRRGVGLRHDGVVLMLRRLVLATLVAGDDGVRCLVVPHRHRDLRRQLVSREWFRLGAADVVLRRGGDRRGGWCGVVGSAAGQPLRCRVDRSSVCRWRCGTASRLRTEGAVPPDRRWEHVLLTGWAGVAAADDHLGVVGLADGSVAPVGGAFRRRLRGEFRDHRCSQRR